MARTPTRAALVATAAGGLVAIAALLVSAAGNAQHFDPKRTRTVVVGPPRGGCPTARVDAARTGFSRTPLPQGGLRVETRRSLGAATDHAPLIDAAGKIYVATVRGDVYAFSPDLTERLSTSTGVPQPGAATLLADGTFVFVGSSGEAVGVRGGALRFRVRVGRGEGGAGSVSAHAAPLALDDGGVVVAAQHELTVLDAEGNLRARTSLPEPAAAPLLSALDKVVAVGASGTVFAWAPGGEPVRVGSFGAPIDGGAALADPRTLLAVTAGNRQIAALDLVAGVAVTRAVAPSGGAYLGPPALRGTLTSLLALSLTTTSALTMDPSGQETARATLSVSAPPMAPDGGAPALVIPNHAGVLVDAEGTLAVGTPEGQVGVVARGTVELLPEAICARGLAGGGRASAITGLAPAGPGAFVAGCTNGAIVRVRQGS